MKKRRSRSSLTSAAMVSGYTPARATWIARSLIRLMPMAPSPSAADLTRILVDRASSCGSALSCSGARWRMTTNAIPLIGGMAPKKVCRALMLPAEPPRPTIGIIR